MTERLLLILHTIIGWMPSMRVFIGSSYFCLRLLRKNELLFYKKGQGE